MDVRLYLADRCLCTSTPGSRTFDVVVDGTTRAQGPGRRGQPPAPTPATMRSWTVTSDGSVDLTLVHQASDPVVAGIEVLPTGSAPQPLAARHAGHPQLRRQHAPGPPCPLDAPLDPATVTAATLIGGTVFYGRTDGNLYRRSLSGGTWGPEVLVDPYNDPTWSSVDTGSGGVYRGLETRFRSELSNLTSLSYDGKGTLLYTLYKQNRLFSRAFSPDSGTVSPEEVPVGGIGLPDLTGAFFVRGLALLRAPRRREPDPGRLHRHRAERDGHRRERPRLRRRRLARAAAAVRRRPAGPAAARARGTRRTRSVTRSVTGRRGRGPAATTPTVAPGRARVTRPGLRSGVTWPRPVPVVGDPSTAAQRAGDPAGWAFPAAVRDALHEVLAARRDVRRYRPDPVPEPVLDRVLAAAHTAPSVGHSQPWRLLVVDDPALRERAAVMADSARLDQAAGMDEDSARHLLDLQLEGIREAPLGVVVCCDRRAPAGGVLGRATFPDADVWSCACAIENLWLAARAEGLGLGWVTLFRPEELAGLLALPEGVVTLGWLCLGWPDERPPAPGPGACRVVAPAAARRRRAAQPLAARGRPGRAALAPAGT